MKVYHHISAFNANKPTVITIGTFDGVHSGHRKILEKIVQAARASNSESLILTFFPHPRMVLGGSPEVKLLNTMDEKIRLLSDAGIDHLVIQPFDTEFAALTPEDFVREVLIGQLNIGKIIIGHDHRFGRNRSAGIDDLQRFGAQFNFAVEQIPAQEINDLAISSTLIRKAIDSGDVSLANEFLGYNYFLSGKVIEGKKLGRTLGFPTANIAVADAHKQVPGNGVYIVSSLILGKTVYGVMNIGTRPTVNGMERSLEVHYLDFEGDLYSMNITVSFIRRIRSEQKFDNLEQLTSQIARDAQFARDFLHAQR